MIKPYRCRCGALASDEGELVVHALERLGDVDDDTDHGWDGEPDRITAARDRWQRRVEVRRKLAETVGVTVDELDEALR